MDTGREQAEGGETLRISAIELERLTGSIEGADTAAHQHQVQPIHLYPEFRPAPRWLEEPIPPDRLEGFVRLARSTHIPLATGEHLYGRWQVHRFLDTGAVSIVQSDPEWCGGVSELARICSVASLYDAQVVPHGHALRAALHVTASQSPAICPLGEYLIIKMRDFHHFEKNPPEVVDGHITLPDRPGFGIELDEAKIDDRELLSFE